MTTLTLRARGPLDPDDAWERYARPAIWPSWSPQISRVECTAGRLAAGASGRVFGPLGLHLDFVVDSWDDSSRQWSWTVRRGLLGLHLVHGVTDRDTGGSETWLRVSGPLPIVLGYAPLAQVALHRLVR